MKIRIYTDGAARGNPGHAGIGVVVLNETGEIIEEYCRYLGTATNNVAEYNALIAGLELAKKYAPSSVDFYLDSELVVRQMQGMYKVKNEVLAGYYRAACELAAAFANIGYNHIPREQNRKADNLANVAINKATAVPRS